MQTYNRTSIISALASFRKIIHSIHEEMMIRCSKLDFNHFEERYWSSNYIYISYQRQQNTVYPKGGRFCENNFLNLVFGSQPIIDGVSLISDRRG